MRDVTREQLNAALNLSVATAGDPEAAARRMPDVASLLASAAPSWRGDPPATRIIVPVSFPIVTLNAAGSTTTDFVDVNFPGAGRVVGICGTVAEGDDQRSMISLSLQIDGVAFLFSNGRGEGFVPLSMLSGYNANGLAWFPFEKEVTANSRWQVRFKSQRPAIAVAEIFTPLVGFLYDETPHSRQR